MADSYSHSDATQLQPQRDYKATTIGKGQRRQITQYNTWYMVSRGGVDSEQVLDEDVREEVKSETSHRPRGSKASRETSLRSGEWKQPNLQREKQRHDPSDNYLPNSVCFFCMNNNKVRIKH